MRGSVPTGTVCSSPHDWHRIETSGVVRSASTEIGLRQFEHWVRLAAHDRWYRTPHVHRYAGSLARISRWQCGHVPRTPPVCPAPVGIATFFTTMRVSSFSAAAARATWPESYARVPNPSNTAKAMDSTQYANPDTNTRMPRIHVAVGTK